MSHKVDVSFKILKVKNIYKNICCQISNFIYNKACHGYIYTVK